MPTVRLALPRLDAGILHGFAGILGTLPLIIPFALLTVVGGVNNTESARVAGDDYDVRSILLAEAAATLVAGLVGGVALRATPYIGHPAYKHMGARAGYTWLTGVFIGLGGMLGYISNLIELIPLAVLAPVLVFLSLNITGASIQHMMPLRHAPAVAVGFFPVDRATAHHRARRSKILIAPERFAQLMVRCRTRTARHGRDPLPARQRLHHHGHPVEPRFLVEMIQHQLCRQRPR